MIFALIFLGIIWAGFELAIELVSRIINIEAAFVRACIVIPVIVYGTWIGVKGYLEIIF